PQRLLEVALELEHRAEVVPQVDARREASLAQAGERARVQADRLLVHEAGARGVAGAAGARGRPVAVPGLPQAAPDPLRLRPPPPLGAELEPLCDDAVPGAARALVDAAGHRLPQVRVGEAVLGLARDRRLAKAHDPLAPGEAAEHLRHLGAG